MLNVCDVDFKFEEFSTDMTRALVAMRDASFLLLYQFCLLIICWTWLSNVYLCYDHRRKILCCERWLFI